MFLNSVILNSKHTNIGAQSPIYRRRKSAPKVFMVEPSVRTRKKNIKQTHKQTHTPITRMGEKNAERIPGRNLLVA